MCITDSTCRVLFICKCTDTFSRCAPLKTIDIQDRWWWQSGTRTTRMMRRRKSKRMESSSEVSLDIPFSTLWYLLLFLSFQLYWITFFIYGGVKCFDLIAYQKSLSTQTKIKFCLYYQITKSQGETAWCFWLMHPKKCLSKEKMTSPPTLTSACRWEDRVLLLLHVL